MTQPDSMGGGVPDVGQPTPPNVSQTPAANTLAGSPSQMMNEAAAVHHSRIADSLNTVGKFLGGDTSYHIVPNSDGSVSATPVESTPGERWGRIAKAALMGAAKGFAVGQGPGGRQRAAAAGIETGMAMPQAQQDQTMALAQKTNDQNQQRQLYNANIAYLNTRNLEQSWQLGENKKVASEHDEDRDLQFNTAKNQLHMTDVGPANDVEQAATLYNGNPAVQQALVNGSLVIHHPAVGPPHAYIIPEDKMSQLNPKEGTAYSYSVDPVSGDVVKEARTVSANTETGRDISARFASENAALLNAIKVGSTVKLQASEAAKNKAAAGAPPKEEGIWQAGTDASGNPIERNNKTGATRPMSQAFLPAGMYDRNARAQQSANFKNYRAASKDYIAPAESAEQSYQLANNAFNDYMAAKKQGKTLPTGAQSMLMLAQHMGTTFGAIKGGPRQTAAMIAQHLGARSVSDDATVAWNKLVNGDELSPKQWTAFHDLISNARQQKWAAAVQQVPHYGVDPRDMSLPQDLNGLLAGVPYTAQTSGGGGGNTQIPEPIAPARPGGRIASSINGKPGSQDANGLWTSDDGTVTQQLAGRRLPSRSIADAMKLPINQGKNQQQVQQDLINHGYNPVP